MFASATGVLFDIISNNVLFDIISNKSLIIRVMIDCKHLQEIQDRDKREENWDQERTTNWDASRGGQESLASGRKKKHFATR